jgi:hypothetical protein
MPASPGHPEGGDDNWHLREMKEGTPGELVTLHSEIMAHRVKGWEQRWKGVRKRQGHGDWKCPESRGPHGPGRGIGSHIPRSRGGRGGCELCSYFELQGHCGMKRRWQSSKKRPAMLLSCRQETPGPTESWRHEGSLRPSAQW